LNSLLPFAIAGGFFLAADTPGYALDTPYPVSVQPSHTKGLKAKNTLDTPDTPKIIKLFFDSELTTHSVPSSEPAAAMVGFFSI
jgi:hypothetical protein